MIAVRWQRECSRIMAASSRSIEPRHADIHENYCDFGFEQMFKCIRGRRRLDRVLAKPLKDYLMSSGASLAVVVNQRALLGQSQSLLALLSMQPASHG